MICNGHNVRAYVPEHFVNEKKRGSFELVLEKINVSGELQYIAGIYVVYKTAFDGGGSGHNDTYPNGHHVFAEKKDGTRIDFWQTGCFNAMIEDIKPIGKAERAWRFK